MYSYKAKYFKVLSINVTIQKITIYTPYGIDAITIITSDKVLKNTKVKLRIWNFEKHTYLT